MKKYLLFATIIMCGISFQAKAVYAHDQPTVTPSICRAEDGSEHEGWKFEYKLKIPVAPPRKSSLRDVSICVPKGGLDVQSPHWKRTKSVNTLEDARAEADKIANSYEVK